MSLKYACIPSMVFALIWTLIGCSSAPRPAEEKSKDEMPSWVSSSPEDTREEVYFVGAGSAAAGDEERARAEASESLVSSVLSYMDVQITSDTDM
ncbi:MAG: hypothetical protein R6V67_09625, partial [Spirochaetia bacterium]